MTKVTLINRVYPPHHGASGFYVADLKQGLEERGFNVDVITAGCHSGKDICSLGFGVGQLSFWMYPFVYVGLIVLTLYHALTRQTEAYIVATDPPCLVWGVLAIAKVKSVPVIYWSHDVYPELFKVTGPAFLSQLKGLHHKIIKGCSAIVVIGQDMQKVYESHKTDMIYNWPLIEKKHKRALNDHITISYTGTLGLIHDVDAIKAFVMHCEKNNFPVQFKISGGGRAANDLKGFRSVNVEGWLSEKDYLERLAESDFTTAALQSEASGLSVPSKCNQALALGCPVLYFGNAHSQVGSWLYEQGGGYAFDPSQSDWLKTALDTMEAYQKTREEKASALSKQAIKLSSQWDRDAALNEWKKILQRVVL